MEFTDITPRERVMLAQLRFCPAVFLGEASLRNFEHMAGGYQAAVRNARVRERHNLLPDGLNEFTATRLQIDPGTRNCFTMIAQAEPDDAKALATFFEILDAYLIDMGREPLPVIRNWEQFHEIAGE